MIESNISGQKIGVVTMCTSISFFTAVRPIRFALLLVAITGFGQRATGAEETQGGQQEKKIKLLIVDGQNNHGTWPKTTAMMKDYLERTGRFDVDIQRTRFTSNGGKLAEEYAIDGVQTFPTKTPQTDPDFKPEFSKYDVVLSNFGYGAAPWPEVTQARFEKFVRRGGGFVVIHAADNSFGDWEAYNKMIGVGGWGGGRHNRAPTFTSRTRAERCVIRHPDRPGVMVPNMRFRLYSATEAIRLPRVCPPSGCMPGMSFTTSCGDRPKTCRS